MSERKSFGLLPACGCCVEREEMGNIGGITVPGGTLRVRVSEGRLPHGRAVVL